MRFSRKRQDESAPNFFQGECFSSLPGCALGGMHQLSKLTFLLTPNPLSYWYKKLLKSTLRPMPALVKGQVHCFSMQVVINKCFFLNPEKNLVQIRLVVFEKNASLIPKNDVTDSFRHAESIVSGKLKLICNLLTV